MLAEYRKKSNKAAAVWLGSLVALLVAMDPSKGNIWNNGDVLAIVLMSANAAAFFYAFWAYLKGKGQSGVWALILPFFTVIGLIVVALLPDKFPEDPVQAKSPGEQ